MVEGVGLLSRCAPLGYQGFESPPFRVCNSTVECVFDKGKVGSSILPRPIGGGVFGQIGIDDGFLGCCR